MFTLEGSKEWLPMWETQIEIRAFGFSLDKPYLPHFVGGGHLEHELVYRRYLSLISKLKMS